jgi:hypothetical protein
MNPEHKYRSPKRLKSMVINNVCCDQLEEFKTNLLRYKVITNQPNLSPSFKWELFHYALTKCSKKCADYLLQYEDVKIPNMAHTFNGCKWNNVHENFLFLKDLSERYEDINFNLDKKDVIKRLIEVSKVETNPKRVDYVFELAKMGFFTLKEVRETINETYAQETKKASVIAILRELNLRELGIE